MAVWLSVSVIALLFTSAGLSATVAHQWNNWSSDLGSLIMLFIAVDAVNMVIVAGMLLYYVQYIAPPLGR